MHFSSSAVAALCLSLGTAAAFSTPAFVSKSVVVANSRTSFTSSIGHTSSCACPACVGLHTPGCSCASCSSSSAAHGAFCLCATCRGATSTRLFSTTDEETEIPPEVEAQDGIMSDEEAHNSERPARSSLKKKSPAKGKALSEFSVGQSVKAKVKTITNYGAFLDIGAATDGLLHISNLSAGFVSDVKEYLEEGQETEVRIMNIDESKNQIGLTLLTEAEEEEAKNASRQPRKQRSDGGGGGRGGGRKDDSAVVAALAQKGYDPSQFVEGTVASTVDFGCFVRFDASQLNPEVEGEMDGLVHISAMQAGRTSSVTSVVNAGDKVKIRCKSIDGRKVSLTMMTVEEEEAQAEARRGGGFDTSFGGGDTGAKDWKESLEKMKGDQPTFSNSPMVVDLRK